LLASKEICLMPSPIIYPEDLVFAVGANNTYSASATTFSSQVSMSTSFSSRARSTKEFANYSIIANLAGTGPSPRGELSLWVCNASFDVAANGQISFKGPVDWVQKTSSLIEVGGQNTDGSPILPPFETSVGLNSWGAVQLRYTATSGSGIFYAKLAGIGG
jgi:hypothetical protein